MPTPIRTFVQENGTTDLQSLADFLKAQPVWKDQNSSDLSVEVLTLLLTCQNENDFRNQKSIVTLHGLQLVVILSKHENLITLRDTILERTNSNFLKEYMQFITSIMTVIGTLFEVCIVRDLDQSFNYLLEEDFIDPIKYKFLRKANIVQNYLALCADENRKSFYEMTIRELICYVGKYNVNHENPEDHLPLPHIASNNFSPLGSILRRKKFEFVHYLLWQATVIDWKKELVFRPAGEVPIIWIPFLPKIYSAESSLICFITAKLKLRDLNQIFVQTLISADDIPEIAKYVLENALNYSDLLNVSKKNYRGKITLLEKNNLQKLVIFSKDKTLESSLNQIALKLKKQLDSDLVILFNLYELIYALIEYFPLAKNLLSDTSLDDLHTLAEWLGQILAKYDLEILHRYRDLSGRNFSNTIAEFRLSLQRKKASTDLPVSEEAELNSALGFLFLSLSDATFIIEQTEIERQINVLTLQIKNVQSKVSKDSFKDRLNEIKRLKGNMLKSVDGILRFPEKGKKKSKKSKSLPVDTDLIETDLIDKNSLPLVEPEEKPKQALPMVSKPIETMSTAKPKLIPKVVKTDYAPDDFFAEDAYLKTAFAQEFQKFNFFKPPSPKPTYTLIQDKNRAFQEYIFMYLRDMFDEMNIFLQRIEYQNKTQAKYFSENEKQMNQKVIDHINTLAEELRSIISTFPSPPPKGTLPPSEMLWDSMEFKREQGDCSIASTLKLVATECQVQKNLAKTKTLEIIKLLHVWNDWVTAHLTTIEVLQTFPSFKKLKSHLELLQTRFYDGFLPVRYPTEEESQRHALLVEIYELFAKKLLEKKLGPCLGLFEHGTQASGYLSLAASFSSDIDIFVELSSWKEKIASIKNFLPQAVDEIKKKYPKRFIKIDFFNLDLERNYMMFKLFLDKEYICDFQISSNYKQSCPGRIIPFGMTALNLLKMTICNAVKSTSVESLFTLIDSSPEQIEAWIRDAPKMSYLLKVLAKSYDISPPVPSETMEVLISMIRQTFNTIIEGRNLDPRNTLTTLFGKDSLRIAGFHELLIRHDLVFIFNLSKKNPVDMHFLNWMNKILQGYEREFPGWSRPIMGHISTVRYLSFVFLYLQEKDPKIDITKIISRCLGSTYFDEALRLVRETQKNLPLCGNNLPICEHFPLQTLFAELMKIEFNLGSSISQLIKKQGLLSNPQINSPKNSMQKEDATLSPSLN